jgi:hypothetical protein
MELVCYIIIYYIVLYLIVESQSIIILNPAGDGASFNPFPLTRFK